MGEEKNAMLDKSRAMTKPLKSSDTLFQDLRALIIEARQDVARQVNSALVLLYWRVGKRIHQDILKEKRAEYGEQILPTLSAKLVAEFGAGFTARNLANMVRFAEVFQDDKILYTLCAKLSWSHFRLIIYLDDDLKRDFYSEMCRLEEWSVRTLEKKIAGMLFERTALSRKPEKLIREELDKLRSEDKLTPVARQKRITVDDVDYYLDLLFYHRKLHCLVAIELKLDKFQAADKGQMELYLRWLEKYEKQPEEESPIGLILCATKSEEHIKLLQLDKSGIRVAAYLTELPPKRLLQKKLHEAMIMARALLERKSGEQNHAKDKS
jgi:predicted nuclease of restriction endonuclease-like (RecB) superfamily